VRSPAFPHVVKVRPRAGRVVLDWSPTSAAAALGHVERPGGRSARQGLHTRSARSCQAEPRLRSTCGGCPSRCSPAREEQHLVRPYRGMRGSPVVPRTTRVGSRTMSRVVVRPSSSRSGDSLDGELGHLVGVQADGGEVDEGEAGDLAVVVADDRDVVRTPPPIAQSRASAADATPSARLVRPHPASQAHHPGDHC
jgi:hypothetical protein